MVLELENCFAFLTDQDGEDASKIFIKNTSKTAVAVTISHGSTKKTN